MLIKMLRLWYNDDVRDDFIFVFSSHLHDQTFAIIFIDDLLTT